MSGVQDVNMNDGGKRKVGLGAYFEPRKARTVEKRPIALSVPSRLEEGVWKIPLASKIAQCCKSYDDMVVYNRQSLGEAVLKLRNTKKDGIIIHGPPGVGKSTAAWFCALTYAEKGSSVCWVNVPTGDYYILDSPNITPSAGCLYDMPSENRPTADVFILDGATKNEPHGRVLKAMATNKTSLPGLVIIVSSMQSNFEKHFNDFETFEMAAWTETEYLQAVKHDAFFDQVLPNLLFPGEIAPAAGFTDQEREDLVLRKFAIAGCSSRWMFDLSVEAAREAIRVAMEEVSNYDVLESMLSGIRSPSVTNRLVVRDPERPDRCRFTSAEVALRLTKLCRTDMGQLHRLVNKFGGMAMRGHALKVDFIDAVNEDRPGIKDILVDRIRYIDDPVWSPQAWSEDMKAAPRRYMQEFDNTFRCDSFGLVGMIVPFYHNLLDAGENMLGIVLGTWMIPKVASQGGFDGVQLCMRPDGTLYLRFVQLTVELNHKIKVYFMRAFLEDFNNRRVAAGLAQVSPVFEVVVVLPMELAERAAAPWSWEVIGDQRTGTRYGTNEINPFVRRVSGYKRRN